MLALALSGCLVIPVLAYMAGGRLVGPYAGARGLATYINAIYSDALSGSPLAVLLVTGPVLIVLIWRLRGWLLQWLFATGQGQAGSQ
jgi:hypothetical protein